MRPLSPPRRPGPSRWRYRLRRAWADPRLRAFVKGYMPLIALALAGWAVVADDRLRLAAAERGAAALAWLSARPELAVGGLAIEGATPALARDIRATLGPVAGQSSLTLDLDLLRDRVEALAAVRRASLYFDPGGLLTVTVVRREPVALWRDRTGALRLIDVEGVALDDAGSRLVYPDLPLVLGDGAPRAVAEALELIAAAPALLPRLRGLVRVGERRWDIVLGATPEDLVIMLPEVRPLGALRGLMALDETQGLLARDLVAVDLRVRARPALRVAPGAAEQMVLRRAVRLVAGKDT